RPVDCCLGLNLDSELERTDLQHIPLVKLDFSLDLFAVDKRAVGRIEIAQENLAVSLDQGAMALADRGTGWPKMTLWIPADDELCQSDVQYLAFLLAGRQYDETELHNKRPRCPIGWGPELLSQTLLVCEN